jgi:flagellin
LGMNQTGAAKSMEKLSSGFRINRAGDDAAGLAISEKMRGQIRGLKQATRNAQDGISLIQTAEGALNETHAILQRMRELAVQSATDTNEPDRKEIQKEINQLAEEITRISTDTEFNTQKLLGGTFKEKVFHIGANEAQNVKLSIADMSANALKVAGSGDGVAEFEITPTAAGVATALEKGEHSFDVVKVDNITTQDGEVANYGLANDKGEIVAVSKDGKTFNWLDKAYAAGSLQNATKDSGQTATVFAETVIGGKVSLEVGAAGALSKVKGIGTIGDVKGLEAGEYSYEAITDDTDFGKYFGAGKIELASSNGLDENDIVGVILNKDGEVAAVQFASENDFYAVDDIDFKATHATPADRITAAKGDAEVAMKKDATTTLDKFEVKADGGINVSSQETADKAITIINDALETVSAERSKLGAMQNRLEHTIANLGTSAENLQAAESRIRDLDMADEIMAFTKNNILQQAATAMLAQANMAPQSVLQLLG